MCAQTDRIAILYRRRAPAPSRASCRHDGARGGVVRPPLRTVKGAFLLGYFLARRSADFDTPWLLVYLFTARRVLVRGPLAGGVVRRVQNRATRSDAEGLHLAQTVNACPDHVAPTARESIETRPPRDATREPAACAAVRFLRSGGKRVQMRSAACRHRSLRIGCP